jgi:hypothetical protein
MGFGSRLNMFDHNGRIDVGMQHVARLLMIFLIAGPPALCRAGLLVRCCESRSAWQATEEAPSSCCESGCQTNDLNTQKHDPNAQNKAKPRGPKPPSRETPRNCSDCAAVCAGAFKPSDGLPFFAIYTLTLPEYIGDCDSFDPRQISRANELANVRPSVPYPSSDIPLRI